METPWGKKRTTIMNKYDLENNWHKEWGAKNGTHETLYNIVCYNTVLDIIRFQDGSQKCVDYIENWPLMVIFLYNLYIFVYI